MARPIIRPQREPTPRKLLRIRRRSKSLALSRQRFVISKSLATISVEYVSNAETLHHGVYELTALFRQCSLGGVVEEELDADCKDSCDQLQKVGCSKDHVEEVEKEGME